MLNRQLICFFFSSHLAHIFSTKNLFPCVAWEAAILLLLYSSLQTPTAPHEAIIAKASFSKGYLKLKSLTSSYVEQ